MGLMRFRVVPTQRITEQMVAQAYLSGIDRGCWPVRVTVDGGGLVLQRSVSDSANLHVPWPVEGYGLLTVTSGSLMERDEPYLLPLELARGTIVQVRNQLSEWQTLNLSVPAAIPVKLTEAVNEFSWAVVGQDEPSQSAVHAEAALRLALAAGDMLATVYTKQALWARRRSETKPVSFLGAHLGAAPLADRAARQLSMAMNTAEVPLCWRDAETSEGSYSWTTSDKQIQWCRTHGLKVLAGPLLILDPSAMPDWFYLFQDDFESMLDFASAFIRAAVERYRGKVDYWICAGRVNNFEVPGLVESERLMLVARTVELIRSLDPDTPVLVSFDQPWGEYLREQESDFPPLHFADALLRAGLDLAGLMLEINVGYWPGGTLLRHPLELNRLLDTWSLFGLPLWLSLCAPSAWGEDSLARHKATLPPESWTAAAQRAWVARSVPLSLVKPTVQGVVWNQLRDDQPHEFPHGGLFDERRRAKPVLRMLAAIRKAYLE